MYHRAYGVGGRRVYRFLMRVKKKRTNKKNLSLILFLSSALVPSMTSEGYGKDRVVAVHVSCTHEDG